MTAQCTFLLEKVEASDMNLLGDSALGLEVSSRLSEISNIDEQLRVHYLVVYEIDSAGSPDTAKCILGHDKNCCAERKRNAMNARVVSLGGTTGVWCTPLIISQPVQGSLAGRNGLQL